jgi:hypothetical protein
MKLLLRNNNNNIYIIVPALYILYIIYIIVPIIIIIIIIIIIVPWFRRSVAGLSPQWPGFDPRAVPVRDVAWTEFPPVSSHLPCDSDLRCDRPAMLLLTGCPLLQPSIRRTRLSRSRCWSCCPHYVSTTRKDMHVRWTPWSTTRYGVLIISDN